MVSSYRLTMGVRGGVWEWQCVCRGMCKPSEGGPEGGRVCVHSAHCTLWVYLLVLCDFLMVVVDYLHGWVVRENNAT